MSEKLKKTSGKITQLPRFVRGDGKVRICVLWRVIFGVLKKRVTNMRASRPHP